MPRIVLRRDQPRAWLMGRVVVTEPGTGLFLVGAINVIAESGGGLYSIVPGVSVDCRGRLKRVGPAW